jgi:hypothetical protein
MYSSQSLFPFLSGANTKTFHFHSGMSAKGDFVSGWQQQAALGVSLPYLSQPALDLLVEYNAKGGVLFIDNGAFTSGVDPYNVVDQYQDILWRFENPHFVHIVAPDVLGDMDKTADQYYRVLSRLDYFALLGAKVIFPFQKGWNASQYRELIDDIDEYKNLGGMWYVGIPSMKCAFTRNEAVSLLTELNMTSGRVHLLGIGDEGAQGTARAIHRLLPNLHITSDSATIRKIVKKGQNREAAIAQALTPMRVESIDDDDITIIPAKPGSHHFTSGPPRQQTITSMLDQDLIDEKELDTDDGFGPR